MGSDEWDFLDEEPEYEDDWEFDEPSPDELEEIERELETMGRERTRHRMDTLLSEDVL